MGCPREQADRLQPGVNLYFQDEHIYEEIDDLICENLRHLQKGKETSIEKFPRNDTFTSYTKQLVTKPVAFAFKKNAKSEENFYIPMEGTTASLERSSCVIERSCPYHHSLPESKCSVLSTSRSGSKKDFRCTSRKEYADPFGLTNSSPDSTCCIGEYIDSWFTGNGKKPNDVPCGVAATEACSLIFRGDPSATFEAEESKNKLSFTRKKPNPCNCELHHRSWTPQSFSDHHYSSMNFTKDLTPSSVSRQEGRGSFQSPSRPFSVQSDILNIGDDASSFYTCDNNYANCGTYSDKNTSPSSDYVLFYNKEREKLGNGNQNKSTNYKGKVSNFNWRQDRELYQVNECCRNKEKRNSVLSDLILRNNITQI